MSFYLKLTPTEAQQMTSLGFNQLFGQNTTAFSDYTESKEDSSTGDLYWEVQNIQKKGIVYDVVGWINDNYPQITKYNRNFVYQFLPNPNI